MDKHFNMIFFGGFLMFLDLNFPFDLLPDFLGFYLVYKALTNLVDSDVLSEDIKLIFKKGINPCIILAFVEFFKWISVIFTPEILGEDTLAMQGLSFIGSLLGILYIYIVYIILKGIYEISKVNGFEIENKAKNTWYVFLTIQVIVLFSYAFNLNFEMETYMFFLSIVSFFINIYVFIFIKSISKKFEVNKRLF